MIEVIWSKLSKENREKEFIVEYIRFSLTSFRK
jgi:hypothetical protein